MEGEREGEMHGEGRGRVNILIGEGREDLDSGRKKRNKKGKKKNSARKG